MILGVVFVTPNNMAKNRRTIITELFEAFAKNDDFDYSVDQLWELFNDCVEKKFIKKLSKEREGKQDGVNSGPKSRGKSGYQHFLSEFSDPIPEGTKKRDFKGAAWAKLTLEEKKEWNQAAEVNEAAGIHKKPAPIKTSQEDNEKYEELLMEWSSKDPETRGPMPSRPSSQKSSPASSQKSSPASSPPTSPKENSTENSNADDDSSDEEDLAEKLANLEMKNNDSDSDSDSEDDDDNADNERIEWLKLFWSEHGLKKNSAAHFKAWIYFTNKDIYGPNKDNNMSNTQFGEFKKTHDYASRSKDEAAPWFEFITKNAIM